MFQLTFTLKQHTPIIHFQHDQAGATLRATELKPKLDRFIMEQLLRTKQIKIGRTRVVNGKHKVMTVHDTFLELIETSEKEEDRNLQSWLVGRGKGEHVALDYKLRIAPISEVHTTEIASPQVTNGRFELKAGKIVVKTFPLYFGNMGKRPAEATNLKWGRIGDISLTITCLNSSLRNYIAADNLIEKFFFQENFGTRQSKGFGCFYPIHEDGRNVQIHIPSGLRPLKFDIDLRKTEGQIDKAIDDIRDEKVRPEKNDTVRVFKMIEWLYQSMRSGINYAVDRQKLYMKPGIFHYAHQLAKKPWDKKCIKQYFFEGFLADQQGKWYRSPLVADQSQDDLANGRDFKDLLGFSSLESWRIPYESKIEKTFSVNFTNEKGEEETADGFNRLASPIKFHIMEQGERLYSVWFWISPLPKRYLKANTTYQVDGDKMNLEMYSSFKGEEFFDLLFRQKHSDRYINSFAKFASNANSPHAIVLNGIFESIKNNLNNV